MDELLGKLAGQAVTLVGRAAFGLVTKVALEQVNKVISKAPTSQADKLKFLLLTFQQKINVMNPAVELLEVALSKGNKALDNIIDMTDHLQKEIQKFNNGLSSQLDDLNSGKEKTEQTSKIVAKLVELISQIDSTASYVQLALSIVNIQVGSDLPKGISPSRLLQASALISATDNSFKYGEQIYPIIGKALSFTLYRLFTASSRPKGKEDFTWKEEYAKCLCYVEREKDPKTYFYNLVLKEDFDDKRYHDEDQVPQKQTIPVSNIKRSYYTSSGSLLNIEDLTSPVLVIKVDKSFDGKEAPEWLALGFYSFEIDESEELIEEIENLDFSSDPKKHIKDSSNSDNCQDNKDTNASSSVDLIPNEIPPFPPQRQNGKPRNSALSLFEYILRLTAAEVSQQKSHLLIPDELLARFLSDDNNIAKK